jgi:hypothetical protein
MLITYREIKPRNISDQTRADFRKREQELTLDDAKDPFDKVAFSPVEAKTAVV